MRKARNWLLVLAAALVGATALSTPAIAAPTAQPNAVRVLHDLKPHDGPGAFERLSAAYAAAEQERAD